MVRRGEGLRDQEKLDEGDASTSPRGEIRRRRSNFALPLRCLSATCERIDEERADHGMNETGAPQRRAAEPHGSPKDETGGEHVVEPEPIGRGEAAFAVEVVAGEKRGPNPTVAAPRMRARKKEAAFGSVPSEPTNVRRDQCL